MNRLVVTFKYTSRENSYCVAIVGHKWLLVIGLCLRIQICIKITSAGLISVLL